MEQIFVWTFADVILAILIAIATIGVFIFIAIAVTSGVIQSRCKHDAGISETWACDAICQKCGKNLGFIGTWRDNQH